MNNHYFIIIHLILFISCSAQTKDAEYYTQLGRSYCADGDYSEGMMYYAKALEIDPNYFDTYIDRGLWKYAIKDYEGAIHDFTFAFSLDSLNLMAIHNLGAVYMSYGNLDSALICYNKAIKIDSVDGSYYNRGGVYYALGYLDLALADYTRVIQFNQEIALPMSYYMRGVTRIELGDSINGKSDLQTSLEIDSLIEDKMKRQVKHLRKYRKK